MAKWIDFIERPSTGKTRRFSVVSKDLSRDLDRIAKRFVGTPRITLVVRNPHLADGDVVLTNDGTDEAIAAIRRLAEENRSK